MQSKKGSYISKQITFGLLGLQCMVDDDALRYALLESDLIAAKKELELRISAEHKEMFDFIFEDLFST